jgi:hypothetical protein
MKNVQGTGFFGNLWRGFVIGAEEVSGYAYDMTPMGVADWLLSEHLQIMLGFWGCSIG